MTTLAEIARRVGKLAADNSPAILTAIGVTGTLTTAYLTGKASFRAAQILQRWDWDEEDSSKGNTLKTKEQIGLVWKLYIPAAGTAALTIAAIVCSNRISDRRAAALAGAYSLLQRASLEYKDKVIAKIGAPKEEQIRTELAQDRVERAVANNTEIIIANGGNVLFYDQFTGRIFESDVDTVNKAVNTINFQINNNVYASLNDFYGLIGLPAVSMGEEFGWNSNKQMDISLSAVRIDDKAYMAIDFDVAPARGYYKGH